MTIFTRTWLVVASVSLLAGWCSAQEAPYFEGPALGWGARHGQREYVPAHIQEQLLPESRQSVFDFQSDLNIDLRDVVEGSWIKVEYIFANFERPGDTLLGAPLGLVENPRVPFSVLVPGLQEPLARVADLSQINTTGENGYRTTFGLRSFRGFDVEGSYFAMQDMTSKFDVGPLPGDPVFFPGESEFYATSLLDDGERGSRVILYDHSFDVYYQSQFWSGDLNIVLDSLSPDTGVQFKPLMGFRFQAYDETLVQHGRFDNSSGLDPLLGVLTTPLENEIRSATRNSMALGQFGFKAELVDEWFTIGIAPKVAIGSNSIDAVVYTEDLRDSLTTDLVDDGISRNRANNVIFGSLLDANAYFSVKVNSWLSFTGSGFLWYMPNVARADQTIVYDDLGIDVAPAMNPRLKTRQMVVHGFTVGAQINW